MGWAEGPPWAEHPPGHAAADPLPREVDPQADTHPAADLPEDTPPPVAHLPGAGPAALLHPGEGIRPRQHPGVRRARPPPTGTPPTEVTLPSRRPPVLTISGDSSRSPHSRATTRATLAEEVMSNSLLRRGSSTSNSNSSRPLPEASRLPLRTTTPHSRQRFSDGDGFLVHLRARGDDRDARVIFSGLGPRGDLGAILRREGFSVCAL